LATQRNSCSQGFFPIAHRLNPLLTPSFFLFAAGGFTKNKQTNKQTKKMHERIKTFCSDSVFLSCFMRLPHLAPLNKKKEEEEEEGRTNKQSHIVFVP
jgi:hypothetical protein